MCVEVGKGYVSVLVAYFASLIEGARILQFFPAYLPESLWMLLTLLSLWLLQVAHLFLVPNSSIQERGCLPLVLVVQEAVPIWPGTHHLSHCIILFSLYTNGYQFGDFRSHSSVSQRLG